VDATGVLGTASPARACCFRSSCRAAIWETVKIAFPVAVATASALRDLWLLKITNVLLPLMFGPCLDTLRADDSPLRLVDSSPRVALKVARKCVEAFLKPTVTVHREELERVVQVFEPGGLETLTSIARSAYTADGGLHARILPMFETDSPKYLWLNDVVSVRVYRPSAGMIAYRVHQILSR
jgi:hypothetical protein